MCKKVKFFQLASLPVFSSAALFRQRAFPFRQENVNIL